MLRSPGSDPERILAMGPFWSGKTFSWLKIADWAQRTGSPAHFYVLDTDSAVTRMLNASGNFSHLTNVTVTNVWEWPQYEKALENASPNMELKSKRIGGANYQVPIEVRPERRTALALRWIITAARSQKGKPMQEKLAEELINASNNTGNAVKKKLDVHRMAEANKAFAHFAW